MADLFQEIMDDMRADRAGEAWNKYGRLVIYTALSIVVITALIVYWKHYNRNLKMEYTGHYINATDALARDDSTAALVYLEKIHPPKSASYYGLVLLKKAQAEKMLGHIDKEKTLLAELTTRADVYGDIGQILLGHGTKNVISETAPLYYSRQEWDALKLLDTGKEKEAAESFKKIAEAEKTPHGIRERAKMMELHLMYKMGALHE